MSMEPAARKMLDEIDEFLATHIDKAGEEVWDVLTALRSPDDPELRAKYKEKNTQHIRTRAFPQTAKVPGLGLITGMRWLGVPEQPYNESATCPGDWHWMVHSQAAAKALGLE